MGKLWEDIDSSVPSTAYFGGHIKSRIFWEDIDITGIHSTPYLGDLSLHSPQDQLEMGKNPKFGFVFGPGSLMIRDRFGSGSDRVLSKS